MEEKKTILEIQHMNISFCQYEKGFRQRELPVIRDLNLSIHEGEMVAVVGSSGSGKSLLAHAVMGMLPYNASMGGEMRYLGEPLTPKKIEKLRGREIALIPQSLSYLDPLMKVGRQICKGKKDSQKQKKLDELFQSYSLEKKVQDQYPFELSGGMTRRIMNCTAMMEHPKLVIADEPTPGLHLAVAKRAMEHFRELADLGAGVLVITHDLELALETADRVVVFYAGHTIEEADAGDFRQESTLRHPYTRALWRALPQNGFGYIPGVQPYAAELSQGCPFAPRCEKRTAECEKEIPYRRVRGGYVRCLYDT